MADTLPITHGDATPSNGADIFFHGSVNRPTASLIGSPPPSRPPVPVHPLPAPTPVGSPPPSRPPVPVHPLAPTGNGVPTGGFKFTGRQRVTGKPRVSNGLTGPAGKLSGNVGLPGRPVDRAPTPPPSRGGRQAS